VTLPDFEYIDTQGGWDRCIDTFNGEAAVAIDLEANSLFAYREQVCLLQFSTAAGDYIVDPLAGLDLSRLGELLANQAVEKIFHASEYDLMLLKRDHDWEIRNLFDTMWAARILGYKNMGLAWFLREFYGVELSKKYQKANWAARPLSTDLLAYARADTHYLLRLRDDLARNLEEAGKMDEARETFAEQCAVRLPDQSFDPEGFWSLRGARQLTPSQQSVLRALYLFREDEARRRDLPVFKVLNNEALINMARENPRNKKTLSALRGVGPRNVERYGNYLLRVIRDARREPPPDLPARKKRHDPGIIDRYERLSQWRKSRAMEFGVESDVILSRDTMWTIARDNPNSLDDLARITGMGPQRLNRHGEEILSELVAQAEAPASPHRNRH
jgi:ribonuclease D